MNGTKLLCGFWGIASLFATSVARADIPPPDSCRTESEACHNAGERYDQDGVCTKATCSKGSASGQVTTYDCLLCQPETTPSSAGATTVTETDDHKDDGGCSVGALGTEKGVATVMLGLGLIALGISRRRR